MRNKNKKNQIMIQNEEVAKTQSKIPIKTGNAIKYEFHVYISQRHFKYLKIPINQLEA